MKIVKSIVSILLILLCWLAYYLTLPAMNLHSTGFWAFALLCIACVSGIVTMFTIDSDHFGLIAKITWGIPGGILVIFLILMLCSSMIFHSDKAYQVADVTVSEVDISVDFTDISKDTSKLPMVDLDTARMLGDKKVAQLNHASWFEVDDEYNLIQYQGDYYRLSVIDYGSWFKYNKAKTDGLPGYVLVEAASKNGAVTQEAHMIELDKPIRYSPGAYFSYDLRRHLRNQYPTYIFDKSFLEIDEEGNPYWVTGIKHPTAGLFGVMVEDSFILTNAQTGASEEFRIEDAPEWIDHVYSLDYLMDLAYWHYAYENGFWNNAFARTNVWRTSYNYRDRHRNDSDSEAGKFANFFGYSSIVTSDGQIAFYTGLTAANSAESNLGWLIIDTSTSKMTQYNLVGAEESSAQAAVEQLVQAQRYEATFPLPVNIGGEASYIMCLKGKAGLVQGYAICNMSNYSVAVQAETIDEAIRLYLRKLGSDINVENTQTSETTETIKATGEIIAIYTAEIDGTTQFYYVINDELYRAAITINEQQVLFEVGDKIEFSYVSSGDVNRIVEIAK